MNAFHATAIFQNVSLELNCKIFLGNIWMELIQAVEVRLLLITL